MNKQLSITLATISVIAATTLANAGTINFSGRSWTTLDNIGRNGNPNTFTTPDANTGVIGAQYGTDSTMATLLTLNAGDRVSFDYYLSNNDPGYTGQPNPAEGGTYYGDWTGIFSTQPNDFGGGVWATARLFSSNGQGHQGMTVNNGEGDNYFNVTSGLHTGIHVEYTFGATGYSVTATSLANPLDTMTDSRNYRSGFLVSDIQSFRVGLWDSEQTATLQNFTVTVPEPSSMALMGLACAAIFLKRVRRA
jgi:hypothetical protein